MCPELALSTSKLWTPLLAPWPFIAFFLFNPEQTKGLMDWFIGCCCHNDATHLIRIRWFAGSGSSTIQSLQDADEWDLLIAAGGWCSQISPWIEGLLDDLRMLQGGFVGLIRRFFLGLLARVLSFLTLGFGERLRVRGRCQQSRNEERRRK